MKKRRIIAIVLIIVIVIVCAGASIQGEITLYREGNNAGIASRIGSLFFGSHKAVGVEEYLESDGEVTVSVENDICFFDGRGTDKALIFYPGAQIEYTAYAPLMRILAENGIDCFLVKMPKTIAFLDAKKAEEIISSHSYESWSLAGHSLGGVVISIYAAETEHTIDGLYLLASYPTKDVKNIEDVLYIYGENDMILALDKVEESKKHAPENFREYVIPGGNHSQFGFYEMPEDDGEPEITAQEQIVQTAEQILMSETEND